LKWEFIESILPASFASQGVLNKDPTVWLDGVKPQILILLVMSKPKIEFELDAENWNIHAE